MNKHQANNEQLPRRAQGAADLFTLLPHFKYQVPHDSHLKSTLILIPDPSCLHLPENILK